MQWTCFAILVFTSTAAEGAYDMSLKSFFLRLLLCTPALFCTVPVVHTHLYPIAGGGGGPGPPPPSQRWS